MSGGLTLLQRLADLDGRPTVLAKSVAFVLAAGATTVAFAAGPDGGGEKAAGPRPVPAGRLVGELPMVAPARTPSLRDAAALPALRRDGSRRPVARAATEPAPVVLAAEPDATPTPAPSAAPVAPVVAPAPGPVRPAPAPAPRPTPPPDLTFDSSG